MRHFTTKFFKKLTLTGALALGFMIAPAFGQQTYDWSISSGGNGANYGTSVASDDSGNVYYCGYFNEEIDLDEAGAGFVLTAPSTETDMFVSKLDPNGNFLWGRHFSSTGRNRAESITIDDNDNVYVTGYFEGTVDFDSGSGTSELTSVSDRDVFILKLDTNGDFLWVKHFGGSSVSQGLDINFSKLDNVLVSGIFAGNFTFDPGGDDIAINAANGLDGFAFRMDQSGNLLDYIQTESTGNAFNYAIDEDIDGNIYIGGFYTGDLDLGGSFQYTATDADSDPYVIKYDNTLSPEWVTIGAGVGEGRIRGLRVGTDNKVYFAGHYDDDLDFTANNGVFGVSNIDVEDLFVGSLNKLGDMSWLHGIGGTESDYLFGLELDNVNNVYTTGYIRQTVDFDPGSGNSSLSSNGGNNSYIWKLNNAGGFEDAMLYEAQFGYDMYVASNWDVFISGYYNGTKDFDPSGSVSSMTSTGTGNAAYISKFSGNCTPPDVPTLTEISNDICEDSTTTIDVTAGNLNDANEWVWYTDSNFTDSVFTGTSYTTPSLSDTMTYYVRAEGACSDSSNQITIFVGDHVAPEVIANDLTIVADSGTCEATGVDLGDTITDNCVLDNITNDAPAAFPIGQTTVTWTVSDLSGNVTIHEQEVTVEDQEAPVEDETSLDEINELCEVTELTAPTATDNCEGSIVGTHNASLPITDNMTITWTYEDANGNITTQDQDVVIETLDVSTTSDVDDDGVTLISNNSQPGISYRWIDCDNNNEGIIGATNQTYEPQENGSYAVIVTKLDCSDTSDCIDVLILGVDENNLTSIEVYPNPSTGVYTITSEEVNKPYAVLDNNGRVILEGTFKNKSTEIDISKHDNGIYFLNVEGSVVKLV
ncbi:MAG: T9SS type A sorting domain-containing protein, partial [Brumimicrobium sp.]